ncbi:DUF2325 domain-containing protein [Labrys wisconsinensis]|uniref:DUF2325 domain-containing protein n=1 Tax=Labrys wisconsinensis TaxID=425677 RepID=A0ABU0J8M4_9HYPH|nr:DUF2325 domain-containing protein [Labrys wisconsinensis]MDQ0470630.1 hypothetical protein [Labrys wisconsinensis]
MPGLSILDRSSPRSDVAAPVLPWTAPPLVATDAEGKRRCRIWDIAANLHCSIVGTCLTAAELRQVFVRLGQADARTATDHALHGRGVTAAGRHDLAGKMLHKALDKRHDAAIRRFAKAGTVDAVRALWRQALDQGEIPGAYWAVLTHPATDRALVQEVFGEVHMLSHMIGSSNRLDLARLSRLEREIGERDEKIARQEQRLQAAAEAREALLRKVESLEAELGRREMQAPPPAADAGAAAATHQRLETERARAATLAARLQAAEAQAGEAERHAAALEAREAGLQAEIAALEALLPAAEATAGAVADLDGRTLLYVGGRPRVVDQMQALVAARGGALLAHDGGMEDNAALLPGLVARAQAAFFPVDCISHTAAGQVKKVCREAGKPFVPLRSASLASFLAALAGGGALSQTLQAL